MSEAITHADARHAAAHDEVGFIRHYVFSTDHKMIGKQFLALGLSMLAVGGALALLVRWQLAWPETPVPGFGRGGMKAITAGCTVKVTTRATSMPSAEMMPNSARPT